MYGMDGEEYPYEEDEGEEMGEMEGEYEMMEGEEGVQ